MTQSSRSENACPSEARSEITSRPLPTMLPRADIIEHAEALTLLLDMPGVTKDKLDIHFERNTLTITGEVEPITASGLETLSREYRAGLFRRSFTLADAFDPERIEAALNNGVVRIDIPKSQRARARKIQIRAS